MSPGGKRFGVLRALAGFVALAAIASVPVIVKGLTSDETSESLAVTESGVNGGGVRGTGSPATSGGSGGSGSGGGGDSAASSGGGLGDDAEIPGSSTLSVSGGSSGGSGGSTSGPGNSTSGGSKGGAKSPGGGGGGAGGGNNGGGNSGGGNTGGSVTGTIKGDAVDTQYGPMQFAIVVRDGKIVGVRDLQLPGDARSLDINGPAMPRLHAQTISRQNASVDTISGATITCQAYSLSIQSALDRS